MRAQSTDAAEWPLERQVGQCFLVGCHGTTPSAEVIALLRDEHVGGVLLFARNVADAAQVRALTDGLRAAAHAGGDPLPLLLAIDQEHGAVDRQARLGHDLPGNMALGATRSPHLARAVARATGRMLAALGISINLAPVLDVNTQAENPIIGTRAYGDDAALVACLGAAAVRGYREAGIACCLKHFPGHGATLRDSHVDLPTVSASRARLEAVELPPFRAGMRAGAECVLVGHLAVPALDGRRGVPASLSSAVVTDLLRTDLGFDGLIIADCLEMGAITRGPGVARAAVQALKAGVDLLIVSHDHARQRQAIAAVRAALATGELPAERVRAACARVRALKQRLATVHATTAPADVARDCARLRTLVASRAVTVARDAAGLLPLRLAPAERVVIAVAASPALHAGVAATLLAEVRRMHGDAHLLVPIAGGAPEPPHADDVLLLATYDAWRDAGQREAALRLASGYRRVVGLALAAPYDARALPDVPTYLVSYAPTPTALEAAVAVLFGTLTPRGLPPVALTHTGRAAAATADGNGA